MLDIHNLFPELKINISRVGVEDVKLILKTKRKDGVNILYPSLSLYVDLPLNKKGVHVSRNLESLNEVLDQVKNKPIRYLENFCSKIAKILLKKHEYSKIAEVKLESGYHISRKSPLTGNISDEFCKVYAIAIATKYNDSFRVRKFIGAEIIGLTYCPCVLQGFKEEEKNYLKNELQLSESTINKILKDIPIASHNQRCLVHAMVETSNKAHINVEDLIETLESSTSSPTYSILKRQDELKVINTASKKPMFVEDVLREVAYKIVKKHPNTPDNFFIYIRVKSAESIHKFDIVSENKTTFEKLKKQLRI